MTDGYLVSDFVVSTVRNLQMKFPVIKSARYRDKTFFYLPGREEETMEAFFKEKPDRIISYSSVEEMAVSSRGEDIQGGSEEPCGLVQA